MFEFVGQLAIWGIVLAVTFIVSCGLSLLIEKVFDVEAKYVSWLDFIVVVSSLIVVSLWYWI